MNQEEPKQMTQAQARALEIYLDTACLENDFTPATFKEIENILSLDDLKGSKSTIQRWSKDFDFESQLRAKMNQIIISSSGQELQTQAQTEVLKKDVVDVTRNEALTSDCYNILESFVDQVKKDFTKNERISQDNVKIVKDIAVLTTNRTDKMLDRIAEFGNDENKLKSDDILEDLKAEVIEWEDE